MQNSELPANVLIVSDDPSVFDLRERLAEVYELWGISSVNSAQKALSQLESDDSIDAVIVGHRVADSDARAFLDMLKATFPRIARVALSQSANGARALESSGAANSALEIPVDVESLQSAIRRAVTLRWRLNDPELYKLLSEVDVMPTPPSAVLQLSSALAEPDIEVGDIAHIIEQDPAMTARLLQLVNSASFGLPNRMTRLEQVISYLGLATVRNVLAAVGLINAFVSIPKELKADVEKHSLHASAVAEVTQQLINDKRLKQDAYVAGMLHDVGLLALLSCAPARYLGLREEVVKGKRRMEEAEIDVLGTSHATVGAYLLEQWKLPTVLCEAVARSHDADSLEVTGPSLVHAVFVAEQQVNLLTDSVWWEKGRQPSEEYLNALGWTPSIAQ